jgi:lysophospholipase L1-like esterase
MNTSLKFTTSALALLGLALGSCQPELDAPATASAGDANFSTYIAVGNSLTAGYQSGGLSREGQLNSYPNILAGQFKQAGGGDFVQPLFAENQSNGSGYLRLAAITNGSPTLAPVTSNLAVIAGSQNSGTNLLAQFTGAGNQNLGVPGIRVADVTTNGYGFNNPLGYNPFFERLLPDTQPATLASYLQYVQGQVAAVKPTFFTNWLGNNDVLGYATSGGAGAPLTPVADFTTKYKQVLDVLTASGAKGLLATIPNVTNVPLFTTVPTASVIAAINATPIPPALEPTIKAALGLPQAAPLPTGLRFGFYITTSAGKRLATANDLLLLTAQAAINVPSTNPAQPFPSGVGLEIPGAPATTAAALAGASNALGSQYVLDATEVQAAVTRTNELNAVIRTEATSRNLALFDSNSFFARVAASGIATNAVDNQVAFIRGNLFSLDGVHPSSRGYAIIANEMIMAINAKYKSTLRQVDANLYPGVAFPQ